MASILKSLRLAADPNRLRILLLLEQEELSVAELQEILSKGQSQISTHLSQLKQAGLVDDRRMGKNSFLSPRPRPPELMELLRQAAVEIPEAAQDQRSAPPRHAKAPATTCAAISTSWPASSADSTCRDGPGRESPRRC